MYDLKCAMCFVQEAFGGARELHHHVQWRHEKGAKKGEQGCGSPTHICTEEVCKEAPKEAVTEANVRWWSTKAALFEEAE